MISPIWIFIVVLALMFLALGVAKIFHTQGQEPSEWWNWADDFSSTQVKLIGVVEVLCALGIIVPKLLGHGYYLTSASAIGLTLLMGAASYTHFRRREYELLGIASAFFVFAFIVAYFTSPILMSASGSSGLIAWINR